ncbi:MAG: T9SS type A sorting domain-containing protein [Bacteroidales bacterium]|nr:T9SS type A sorting domain-containing protein [Bacteroidales bacterium]
MKQKLLLALLILVAGMNSLEADAQNLVIKTIDGKEAAKPLSTLKNMTFPGGKLLLTYTSGSTDSYSLTNISKLFFGDAITGIDDQPLSETAGELSVYPNPAENVINLKNAPEGISTVKIYRMEGVMVLNKEVSAGSLSIDVSNLAKGFYLLTLNGQAFKFIKL